MRPGRMEEGGAPRCRAGLEHLMPSAQLMVAGPPLLIWINVDRSVVDALADGSSSKGGLT